MQQDTLKAIQTTIRNRQAALRKTEDRLIEWATTPAGKRSIDAKRFSNPFSYDTSILSMPHETRISPRYRDEFIKILMDITEAPEPRPSLKQKAAKKDAGEAS